MKLDIAAVAKSLRQIFCLPLIILCNTVFAESVRFRGGCSDASATKYLAGHSDVAV
jgi:cystathionine beta-lyase/cystathionine gamma-synthase